MSTQPQGNDIIIKRVDAIRSAVKNTFEELSLVEDKIQELQQKKSCLKRDLIDLKEGRLDRICERHKVDIISRSYSVFTVELQKNTQEKNPWYMPYVILIQGTEFDETLIINNSMTKINAPGTFKLKNGEVRYL